jgi:Lipase (class 3)
MYWNPVFVFQRIPFQESHESSETLKEMRKVLVTWLLILKSSYPFSIPHSSIVKRSLRSKLDGANAVVSQIVDEATSNSRFDMRKALFCAGVAFDAYVEPPSNSSRWEKGSSGLNVAFASPSFTRNLYKGLVEIKVQKIYDLPDDDNTAESLVTGGGVDAYLLVAVVEGQWKEDVKMLEKEAYHEGVLGLQGAAHVGRSRTAWSNINENQSKAAKRKEGISLPYHIRSSWMKGGQAIYSEDEPPFYLYIQDPSTSSLVLTVMDDDVIGDGSPIGSAHVKLENLIPDAKLRGKQLLDKLKQAVIAKIQTGEIQSIEDLGPEDLPSLVGEWNGEIKLTSKPRIENKNGQVTMAAAAGAMVAGPVGAAAGALIGALYEGEVRGRIQLNIKYLPILPVETKRSQYVVKGGMPGIDWGELYFKFLSRQVRNEHSNCSEEEIYEIIASKSIAGKDLEQCFFINHDSTGGCCSVYRSLERKVIVISFRGTCVPKDLVTDLSLAQDAWVSGEDVTVEGVAKVHSGFRKSMNSISRRLKELILAIPAPGESIEDYAMYVTGHSLGGALATLFTLDIAEFGIDAGRALPQKESSEDWWKSIITTLGGNKVSDSSIPPPPPRPKALYMYNFGSPRVGNREVADRFGILQRKGWIDEAYRVVNGDDVVARNPRTINALAFGNIGYDHCAATVLVAEEQMQTNEDGEVIVNPKCWIEGESDDEECPVRDGTPLRNPLSNGSLLSYIVNATQESFFESEQEDYAGRLKMLASKVSDRFQSVSVADMASIVGIDQKFASRELRMIQSLGSGYALSNHMEDSYYASIGRACGFQARVGEVLCEIEY